MKLASELHLKFQGFKVKQEIYKLVIHTVNDAIKTIDNEEALEMLRRDLLEALAVVKNKQDHLWAVRHNLIKCTVKCNDL